MFSAKRLSVCKSYQARARAANANGAGAWRNSQTLDSPKLAAAVFQNSANISLFNYSGDWHYKANVGLDTDCSVSVSES